MCGIYGLWSDTDPFPSAAISRALAHRGPDDAGSWQDGPIHLGHRRLSIIDLSADGHQPFRSADGRYVLTYNGEVYNYVELRRELEAEGVRFHTDTDTEVLLQGYARWGANVLPRLYGMFAFGVWDHERRELFLARDATGIKPLYYAHLGPGRLAFASELKAFAALDGLPFEPDEEAIQEYLGAGYVWSSARCAVRGVRKLPPGHYLRVHDRDEGGTPNASPVPARWWTPPTPEPLTRPVTEAIDAAADRLHDLLARVTAQHLRADVPVGLLLSGGLDSSVLAALAARALDENGGGALQTVTMGFEPYERDERVHARAVADHIGSEHHEIVVRPADAARELFENAHHLDDLFGDSGTIPAFAAFRACRELGLKVVLVGEGADEVLGGYPSFSAAAGSRSDAWTRQRLFRYYTRQRYGVGRAAFSALLSRLHEQAGGDWFHTVRLFELQHQLPVSLNLKVDHASMASSVEARVPYQDRRVVEFACRTPSDLLLEPGVGERHSGKWLLRHMARKYDLVPESILERRKMGTPVPWGWLHDGAFADTVRETLLAPDSWTRRLGFETIARGFLDDKPGDLPHRLRRRLGPYANHGWLTMNLLVLDAWAQSSIFHPEAEPTPSSTQTVAP